MAIRLLLISVIFSQSFFTYAQMYWEWVPGAPTFTPAQTERTIDITFVDDTVGYLITNAYHIYKTTDGGDNWDSLVKLPHATEMEFISRDTGFAACPYDTGFFYTIDGGYNWVRYEIQVQGPSKPQVVSISKFENTLYCLFNRNGRELIFGFDFSEPPIQFDTLSEFSSVRGYMPTSATTSLAFGDSTYNTGKIIFSDDSRETWQDAFTCPPPYKAYDMQIVDSSIGYALLGKSSPQKYFLIKTTDGGRTWNGIPSTDTITVGLGAKIFFISENIGWTGYPSVGLLETTDGGATWHFIYEGQRIYCFAKTPSGVVYAAGANVIRLDSRLINSLEQISPPSKDGKQFSVFPNPASNYFSVVQAGSNSAQPILVKLFDVLGEKLLEQRTDLTERVFIAGLSNGVYNVQISTAGSTEFQTLVINQRN